MKKILSAIIASLTLLAPAMAQVNMIHKSWEPSLSIPHQFSSTSETSTYEWGCPVAEVVNARSGAEALQKVGSECMEEARRAAIDKPDVFEVIQISVIVPDVQVSPTSGGYYLQGTFFLETLVLKGVQK